MEHFSVTVCGVFYCAHQLQWFSISSQWVSLYDVTYPTEPTVPSLSISIYQNIHTGVVNDCPGNATIKRDKTIFSAAQGHCVMLKSNLLFQCFHWTCRVLFCILRSQPSLVQTAVFCVHSMMVKMVLPSPATNGLKMEQSSLMEGGCLGPLSPPSQSVV